MEMQLRARILVEPPKGSQQLCSEEEGARAKKAPRKEQMHTLAQLTGHPHGDMKIAKTLVNKEFQIYDGSSFSRFFYLSATLSLRSKLKSKSKTEFERVCSCLSLLHTQEQFAEE